MPDYHVNVSHRLFLMHPNTVSVYELIADDHVHFKLMLETEEGAIKLKNRSVFEFNPDGIDWVYLNLRDMLKWKLQGGDTDTANHIRAGFITKVVEMLKNTIPDVEMQVSDKDTTRVTRNGQFSVYDISFVQHSNDDEPVRDPSVALASDFFQPSSEKFEKLQAELAGIEDTPAEPPKSSRHDCVNYVPLDR